MKQSRWASLGEQCVNTFSGFGLSLLLQWLYFDVYLGMPLHPIDNLNFAIGMTVVSLARGFSVRRIFEAAGLRIKFSPAMQAVIAERLRQQNTKGYDAAHDDAQPAGVLALAGACYLRARGIVLPHDDWPLTDELWNPKDVRSNLVTGTALGLAEIERLDRLRARRKGQP